MADKRDILIGVAAAGAGAAAGAAASAAAYRSWREATERTMLDGKPTHLERVLANEVKADPDAFQFKSGGDHAGVTDRLKGVSKWNAAAAGKVMVFERATGERVIADGHQRRGLAERLMSQGHEPIKLDAIVLRERDGWTPRDVRAYAAIKNMHESSGQSLDMAKVMRERPDLVTGSLPVSDAKIKEAKALARLSEPAFKMVVGGAVKPEHAAAVGEMMAGETSRHLDMMTEMQKAKIASAQHARLYVQQAMAAPSLAETSGSLFGEETTTRSLLKERAAVLDKALSALKSDKRIFGLLEREASNIEGAGNKLAHEANAAKAEGAGRLAELVEKLATNRGPVSSMLDKAAGDLARGSTTAAKAAREFVRGVGDTMKAGGLRALSGDAPQRMMMMADDSKGAPMKGMGALGKKSDAPPKIADAVPHKGTPIPPPPGSKAASLRSEIAALEHENHLRSMSDDRWHSNGGYRGIMKEIDGKRSELAKLEGPAGKPSAPAAAAPAAKPPAASPSAGWRLDPNAKKAPLPPSVEAALWDIVRPGKGKPETSGLRGTQNPNNLEAILKNRKANAAEPKESAALSVADMKSEAKAAGIKGASKMTKSALMEALGKGSGASPAQAAIAHSSRTIAAAMPPDNKTAASRKGRAELSRQVAVDQASSEIASVANKAKAAPAPKGSVNPKVAEYASRLEKAIGDSTAHASVMAEIKADKSLKLADLKAVAKEHLGSASGRSMSQIMERLGRRQANLDTFAFKQKAVGGRSAASLVGPFGPLAIVGAGAVAFDAKRSEAKAAGQSDLASTMKGMGSAAAAGGTVAAIGAGIGAGAKLLARGAAKIAPVAGAVASKALPVLAIGMAAYDTGKGAYEGYKRDGTLAGAAKGAGRGLADFATMGAYSHFSPPAGSGGHLTAEQAQQFRDRSDAAPRGNGDMQPVTIPDHMAPRGWANPATQRAAQMARGVNNMTDWAQSAEIKKPAR